MLASRPLQQLPQLPSQPLSPSRVTTVAVTLHQLRYFTDWVKPHPLFPSYHDSLPGSLTQHWPLQLTNP